IDHLLVRAATETGRAVRFNTEAKARYLRFARSADAPWRGNFRDLSASVTRMATLADGGRISTGLVDAEIQRLQWQWQSAAQAQVPDVDLDALLPAEAASQLDLFDRLQLEAVIRICQQSQTLSDAGRRLFDQSRSQRAVVNDADRLRKYLLKFGLTWDALRRR
ncbi:MAG: sigma 54-dependent transcriptional regulator, partial [Rhodocyclaceae bacterium]